MKIRYGFLVVAMFVFAGVGLLAQQGPPPNGPKDQNSDRVKFISIPTPTARVNTPYVYTAHAVSSDSTATIRYSGWFESDNPMRMSPIQLFPIDSATGVSSWTPTAKGWYDIVINAVSDSGGRARQEFEVLVSGGVGAIQGRVTDTLGNGIQNIIVQALKTDVIPVAGPTGDDGGFFSYSAKTDANGYYTITHVDVGSYLLRAISPTPNYASQWYDGKTNASSANVVTVADSAVANVSFVLRGGPAQHMKGTVSGTVVGVDTLGVDTAALNVPTRVFLVRAGFALNSNSSIDDFRQSFDDNPQGDFRMDKASAFVFSTAIDSLGNYSMNVPPGYYIAVAKAAGYVTTFYLNQTDVASATVITVQSDSVSGNINFTLAPLPPVVFGSISGTVIDTAQAAGVRARVIAFRDRWTLRDGYRLAHSYTTDTDSTGAYSFTQLLPGSYIVFAIPVGNYAPSYYTTDTSAARWKRATRLAVNGNSFTGINIDVRPLPAAFQGYGGITGRVRTSDQSGVAGSFVYALANGQVCGYGITGSNGSYSVSGLAPGTYSLVFDKTGFDEVESQSAITTYDNTTTSSGRQTSTTPVISTVNFSVAQTAVATSVPLSSSSNVVREYSLGQNYPNPFNPSTTITYALPQAGKATLKIFNILGQKVATLVDENQSTGVHQVLFNADKLSSGVYFYQLQSGSFVQSKKMILLK